MVTRSTRSPAPLTRQQLKESIGRAISRVQDASVTFDDLAAEILALDRADLPCMTRLLFAGPATPDELALVLGARRRVVLGTLERLQLAGYARFQAGGNGRIELTEHARTWIERIWSPLSHEGYRALDAYQTRHLSLFVTFLRQVVDVQERVSRQLQTWLERPASAARRSHLRGGLSPAALRRVQLFVEGNLDRSIHLNDMAARAALSPYHFARAFKTSAGMTPRAFVEQRRIERAKQLLLESSRPLAQIAIDTGFGTQSRLTTTFRVRTGFTPAAYRRAQSST